jgi:hypothetical protein
MGDAAAMSAAEKAAMLEEAAKPRSALQSDKPRWWIINPDNFFLHWWDGWIGALVLYTVLVYPFYVFFGLVPTGGQVTFDNILYASFVVDVAMHFLRGYHDPVDGHVVTSPAKIAVRYARGWLLVDLISILPLEFVNLGGGGTQAAQLTRLLRLARMARLVKLLQVSTAAQQLYRWVHGPTSGVSLHPAFARMAGVFGGTLLAFLWLACGWWFLGISNNTGEPVWLDFYTDGGLRDKSVTTQFISSFWFIVSCMASLGIGDIAPKNNRERIYAMFLVLFGLLWGALLIADLSTLVQEIDASHTGTVAKRRKLELFAKHARLPAHLRSRLMTGFDRVHARESAWVIKAGGYDPREVLGYGECAQPTANAGGKQHRGAQSAHRAGPGVSLAARIVCLTTHSLRSLLCRLPARPAVPEDIRRDVVLWTRRRLRAGIPLLASLPDAPAAWILERLHRRSAMKGELLALEDAPAAEMFFLTSGRVELTHGGVTIATYGPGAFFGDIDCLFAPARLAGIDALVPTEYYVLSSGDLHDAVHKFPELATRLRRTAAVRLRRYGDAVGEPLVGEDFLAVLDAADNNAGNPGGSGGPATGAGQQPQPTDRQSQPGGVGGGSVVGDFGSSATGSPAANDGGLTGRQPTSSLLLPSQQGMMAPPPSVLLTSSGGSIGAGNLTFRPPLSSAATVDGGGGAAGGGTSSRAGSFHSLDGNVPGFLGAPALPAGGGETARGGAADVAAAQEAAAAASAAPPPAAAAAGAGGAPEPQLAAAGSPTRQWAPSSLSPRLGPTASWSPRLGPTTALGMLTSPVSARPSAPPSPYLGAPPPSVITGPDGGAAMAPPPFGLDDPAAAAAGGLSEAGTGALPSFGGGGSIGASSRGIPMTLPPVMLLSSQAQQAQASAGPSATSIQRSDSTVIVRGNSFGASAAGGGGSIGHATSTAGASLLLGTQVPLGGRLGRIAAAQQQQQQQQGQPPPPQQLPPPAHQAQPSSASASANNTMTASLSHALASGLRALGHVHAPGHSSSASAQHPPPAVSATPAMPAAAASKSSIVIPKLTLLTSSRGLNAQGQQQGQRRSGSGGASSSSDARARLSSAVAAANAAAGGGLSVSQAAVHHASSGYDPRYSPRASGADGFEGLKEAVRQREAAAAAAAVSASRRHPSRLSRYHPFSGGAQHSSSSRHASLVTGDVGPATTGSSPTGGSGSGGGGGGILGSLRLLPILRNPSARSGGGSTGRDSGGVGGGVGGGDGSASSRRPALPSFYPVRGGSLASIQELPGPGSEQQHHRRAGSGGGSVGSSGRGGMFDMSQQGTPMDTPAATERGGGGMGGGGGLTAPSSPTLRPDPTVTLDEGGPSTTHYEQQLRQQQGHSQHDVLRLDLDISSASLPPIMASAADDEEEEDDDGDHRRRRQRPLPSPQRRSTGARQPSPAAPNARGGADSSGGGSPQRPPTLLSPASRLDRTLTAGPGLSSSSSRGGNLVVVNDNGHLGSIGALSTDSALNSGSEGQYGSVADSSGGMRSADHAAAAAAAAMLASPTLRAAAALLANDPSAQHGLQGNGGGTSSGGRPAELPSLRLSAPAESNGGGGGGGGALARARRSMASGAPRTPIASVVAAIVPSALAERLYGSSHHDGDSDTDHDDRHSRSQPDGDHHHNAGSSGGPAADDEDGTVVEGSGGHVFEYDFSKTLSAQDATELAAAVHAAEVEHAAAATAAAAQASAAASSSSSGGGGGNGIAMSGARAPASSGGRRDSVRGSGAPLAPGAAAGSGNSSTAAGGRRSAAFSRGGSGSGDEAGGAQPQPKPASRAQQLRGLGHTADGRPAGHSSSHSSIFDVFKSLGGGGGGGGDRGSSGDRRHSPLTGAGGGASGSGEGDAVSPPGRPQPARKGDRRSALATAFGPLGEGAGLTRRGSAATVLTHHQDHHHHAGGDGDAVAVNVGTHGSGGGSDGHTPLAQQHDDGRHGRTPSF